MENTSGKAHLGELLQSKAAALSSISTCEFIVEYS